MKLLVTLRPGIGKTTAVRKVLERLGTEARGFESEEIRDPLTHQRMGFRIIATDGQSAVFAHRSFRTSWRVGSYGIDVKIFKKAKSSSDATLLHITEENRNDVPAKAAKLLENAK